MGIKKLTPVPSKKYDGRNKSMRTIRRGARLSLLLQAFLMLAMLYVVNILAASISKGKLVVGPERAQADTPYSQSTYYSQTNYYAQSFYGGEASSSGSSGLEASSSGCEASNGESSCGESCG